MKIYLNPDRVKSQTICRNYKINQGEVVVKWSNHWWSLEEFEPLHVSLREIIHIPVNHQPKIKVQEVFITGLKTVRKARQITQVELSVRTGIEQSLISKYESGVHRAGQRQITRLCEVLQCESSELIRR